MPKRFGLIALVLAVAALTVCTAVIVTRNSGQANDSGPRRTVEPQELLMDEGPSVDGVGVLSNLPSMGRRTRDANHETGVWSSRSPARWYLVYEEAYAYASAESAINGYEATANPRTIDLRELGTQSAGPATVEVTGLPESSQYYCSSWPPTAQTLMPKPDCYRWVWWARFGQYVIVLEVENGYLEEPMIEPIPEADFLALVNYAAEVVAASLL